jgi:hypothetical protein
MNIKKLITYLPYGLLLLANVIYIYANGLKSLGSYPELYLYNFLLFFVVGIVIMIKANLLLHSWFVKEEGDVKGKTKKGI